MEEYSLDVNPEDATASETEQLRGALRLAIGGLRCALSLLAEDGVTVGPRIALVRTTLKVAATIFDAFEARAPSEVDLAAECTDLRLKLDATRSALSLLVADVQDYEAWQRPCYALDVARAALQEPVSASASAGREKHA